MCAAAAAAKSTARAEEKAGLPVLPFASAAAFARWVARQPADSKGLWLKLAKKGNEAPSITHAQAIDCALCHGWIDGQINGYDEAWWLVRFTPRKPRSKWSKINTQHVARLIEEGRMQAAGLAQVEAAKADGRWDAAYASQATATVPQDLQAALDANRKAKAFFEQLKGANRYAILYRVHEPKRPETRARRIANFVAMLARGETIHPFLAKKEAVVVPGKKAAPASSKKR